MEVKGDDSKLDKEQLWQSKKKVKEWWHRALWRKLDKWEKDKESRTWGDYKRYIKLMFVNGEYEKLKEQMVKELRPRLVMTREDLEDYLIGIKFRDFTNS